MGKLGAIWLEIRAKQDKLRSDFSDAKKTVSRTADEMEGRLKGFGIAAAASIGAIGFAAIRVGTEFESNMKTVQAFSGATGEDLENLTKIAREMGAATEFSATEASQGLQFLAAAGLTVTQQMAALPGVIDLATASQVDLATATDITTDTMTAFNLEVEDLDRVSDALVNTTSRTNTNLLQLGEAMKFVAPVAGQMGISIENTSALLGTLANSGLKASLGGTSLRTILLSVDKAAKKLGLEGGATLVDVLREMEEQQIGTTEQTAIFGKIATTGVGILRNNIDKVAELTGALEDNQGATGSLADIMRDSLGVEIKTLGSSIEENLLKVFDIFKDDASIIVGNLTDITRAVGGWIDANQTAIKSNVVDSIKAFSSSVLNIATFINKNPDILQWGLFGFVIFGRKGAVLGALFGKVVDLTDRFSKNLGKVSVEAGLVTNALLAAGLITYAEGIDAANDKSKTFTITNQETGESIEKTDSLLGGLVTTMLDAVNSTGSLSDSTKELQTELEKIDDEWADFAFLAYEATEAVDFFKESIDAIGAGGFVSLNQESRTFFENMSKGWHGAQGDLTTWGDLAEDVGKTASRGMHDAISSNLFDVLTGDFDNLGDAWEGLMGSMLSSFTDSIADMVLEGGKLGNTIALLGAAGTIFNAFQQSGGAGGGSLVGAGIGFAAGGPLGALVGAQIGGIAGGLLDSGGTAKFKGGDLDIRGGFESSKALAALAESFGKFDFGDAIDAAEEIADTISDGLSASIFNLPEQYRDQFESILSEQPIEVPFELNEEDLEGSLEKFASDLGDASEAAFSTSLGILAASLGFVSAAAFTDYLEMIERTSEASGQTIGNAFRVGLESSSFADFGDTIRQQVFDSVFEGMITALTQSEVYRQALQPIFAGIEDAFTVSFATGDFDPEVFASEVQPSIDAIEPAINALEPLFTAVADIFGPIKDAILGPQDEDATVTALGAGNEFTAAGNDLIEVSNQKLDDIDLHISDLTNSNDAAADRIVESVNNLGGDIRELAGRPINVTTVVDLVSLDSRIEDVVVEREESELTDGERTVSL